MGPGRILSITLMDDIPETNPDTLASHLGEVTMIDVRRPEEFTGELSHIPGARLITLGPQLDEFLAAHDKNEEIVFVCRSGARSGQATRQAQALGFKTVVNLRGGMLLWNELNLPVDTRAQGGR